MRVGVSVSGFEDAAFSVLGRFVQQSEARGLGDGFPMGRSNDVPLYAQDALVWWTRGCRVIPATKVTRSVPDESTWIEAPSTLLGESTSRTSLCIRNSPKGASTMQLSDLLRASFRNSPGEFR